MARRAVQIHSDWLTLVEPSGPFLTLPVLRRVLPDGLERTPVELRAAVRERYETLGREVGARVGFVGWVLRSLLGYEERVLEGQAVPDSCTSEIREHSTYLRPDFVIWDPGAKDGTGAARLLVAVHPTAASLTAHLPDQRWAASPVDRMTALCRATGCEVGMVTDGDRFCLVWAPPTGVVARATWVAGVFTEGAESKLLDSFTTLLGARRCFAAAPENRLEALLVESTQAQAEVSGRLGLQVRRAVELLVAAISRENVERGGRLLSGVEPREVYEAVATVMMRLIFLLYAEERRLLPIGDDLYNRSYAASTLVDLLAEEAYLVGEETLEHRSTAWPRLLATFRAVYAGLSHDALRIPAYGGRLFDPDRYPFLEGRQPGASWQAVAAEPLPVDDRTMWGVLRALQFVSDGARDVRRLAFRALDVEQIGHVYESLLDHSTISITRTTVGLVGTPGDEPEVALGDLERKAEAGRESLIEWLVEETGKTRKQIEKLLDSPVDEDRDRLLRAACDNDEALASRLRPFAELLRDDLRGLPVVLRRGQLFVTSTSQRRDTGTEYTPKELADEVVRYALEPLVYRPGPAEGADPSEWTLIGSEEMLRLRICDMAVGSGAFLVAACRYLADRLVEAWRIEGRPVVGELDGRMAPEADADDLTIEARRAIVEHCLYGVDRDPMAVEMAKLSLWLTTLARERPFSFVDHALQSGDSLLGVTDFEQLRAFHLATSGVQLTLAGSIQPAVDRALELRRRLGAIPVVTVRDAEEKRRLLAEADGALRGVRAVGDLIVGAALVVALDSSVAYEDLLAKVTSKAIAALDFATPGEQRDGLLAELETQAEDWLNRGRPADAPPRHCLHWPLAFPEVFQNGGRFHRVIGNPPFLGGQRLTARIGEDVREYVIRYLAGGRRGSADLVAYFFLRAAQVAEGFGLLATNTIGQGDTREVGLDQLTANGWTIQRAVKSLPWPGQATVEISKVWALRQQDWNGGAVLDERPVYRITTSLASVGRVEGRPYRLSANAGKSFQGSILLGMGFITTPSVARGLIAKDPRNADVLFPYLNGEDLNTSPTQEAKRWVINFFDWPEEKARQYLECFVQLETLVKPERQRKRPDGTFVVRGARARAWWQFAERATSLNAAIARMDRVLAIARISKTVQPVFCPTAQVFNEKVVVFPYDDDFHFGVLTSAPHWHWAVKYSSTLGVGVNYAPSDAFETFPQPASADSIRTSGRALNEHRRDLMVANGEGLTKTYNRVHNPADTSPGIVGLREWHRILDLAVCDAYGWSDLVLDHGFHDTPQGCRFTVSPVAREELLDRLLELNHARYAAEQARGVHSQKKSTAAKRSRLGNSSNQTRLL